MLFCNANNLLQKRTTAQWTASNGWNWCTRTRRRHSQPIHCCHLICTFHSNKLLCCWMMTPLRLRSVFLCLFSQLQLNRKVGGSSTQERQNNIGSFTTRSATDAFLGTTRYSTITDNLLYHWNTAIHSRDWLGTIHIYGRKPMFNWINS